VVRELSRVQNNNAIVGQTTVVPGDLKVGEDALSMEDLLQSTQCQRKDVPPEDPAERTSHLRTPLTESAEPSSQTSSLLELQLPAMPPQSLPSGPAL